MGLKDKIGEIVRKKDKPYIIARCIKNLNDPDFIKLIKGYYESPHDYTTLLAKHNGIKFPDEMVYYIQHLKPIDEDKIERSGWGFCSILRLTLGQIYFSDMLGMTPVVEWGMNFLCYDPGMDSVTRNVFEYYFEPVSKVDYKEVKNCKNVVESRRGHRYFLRDHVPGGAVEQEDIEKIGYVFKKYIRFNSKTKEYIDNNVKKIQKGETILAVHVRGTDFNMGLKDHPIVITPREYLAKAKELFASGEYDKVFLATDDANALELFKKEFKEKLLYYDDAFRTRNHIGPHCTPNSRPLHYYKIGLEVLRDVYTLANCESLVCGWSSVSFAARYVNYALGRKFREIAILDNGVNAEDSDEVKRYWKQVKKMNRKLKHELHKNT